VKRAFGLAIAMAALAAVAGCAASRTTVATYRPFSSPLRLVPPSPTSLRFSTASNQRFARKDVQGLIRILVLPPGARVVAKVPRSAPRQFRNTLTGTRFLPGIAVTHRVWIVHEPLRRVVRFVQAHADPRPRPEARFRGKNNGIELRPVGSYAFPPVPGRSWDRWLTVDMVALSGGGTAVIAQAGDAWVHPSPRSALLAAAVKRIDVVSRFRSKRPNVLVHVRRPYEVGSIVSLVNGLGLANTEHIACLAVLFGGPTVTLRFRTANGKLLARANVRDILGGRWSGPCNPLQLTVRGRAAPPLIGADLLLRLQRLLNVDLAPRLPREVSACLLHRHGWKVKSSPRELKATKNGRRWTISFHSTGKVTLDKTGPPALERCLRS
jgi:hypothetical protein